MLTAKVTAIYRILSKNSALFFQFGLPQEIENKFPNLKNECRIITIIMSARHLLGNCLVCQGALAATTEADCLSTVCCEAGGSFLKKSVIFILAGVLVLAQSNPQALLDHQNHQPRLQTPLQNPQ